MTAPVFVDTNVFVYRFDSSEPAKHARATAWLDALWAARAGRVSTQVLHELYATLGRKLAMPVEDARRVVRSLLAWKPLSIDQEVVERAWSLETRHALSWWDALIVAAAQASGASVLLTEDLQHGQTLGDLQVLSPFMVGPEALTRTRRRAR